MSKAKHIHKAVGFRDIDYITNSNESICTIYNGNNGKKHENVSKYWKKVTCPRCLGKKRK